MPTSAKEMAPLREQLEQMQRLHAATHRYCVVCGAANPRGLQVDFRPTADGGVEAHFDCPTIFEGYSHRVHGGVAAALLDGAMTNCLFAHGHVAVTAELAVRYRHPVMTDRRATVRAWICESSRRLHRLRAELAQDGRVLVTATAKFFEPPSGGSDTAGADAG
jgi:acyl-coenzyme A thioesterase PaaI-like protein